jgi:predicted RNase H-like nuclease (RuvC/YqgF family)
MNFGLAFAGQKIPGISFDLAAINNNHEPESTAAALVTYSKLLMPERNIEATIKRLTPLINDPAIQQKVTEAAGKSVASNDMNAKPGEEITADEMTEDRKDNKNMDEDKLSKQLLRKGNKGKEVAMASAPGNNSMLAQVVGIILGSPEFQRR